MVKKESELFQWIISITIALVLAAVIRNFIFSPIEVKGKSMEPTLYEEDRMLVSKLGTPKRFDIVVFHADEKKDYVKRVIGLPGDQISYKNDALYINGKAYPEKYLEKFKKKHKKLYGDNLLFTEDFTLKEETGHKTVPKNTLFVMGDNRQNSTDSRHIGFIPIDSVIGNTKVLFWPIKNIQIIK